MCFNVVPIFHCFCLVLGFLKGVLGVKDHAILAISVVKVGPAQTENVIAGFILARKFGHPLFTRPSILNRHTKI